MYTLKKQKIVGVDITDAGKIEVLQYVTTSLEKKIDAYYIVTPNPEIIVLARRRKDFQEILNQAQIALPDGVGVLIAAKILGKPLRERITGVDLLQEVCKEVSEKPITVGFLGGRGGVALKASECLKKRYPGLRVSFVGEEWAEPTNSKWQIANGKEENFNKETISNKPYAISNIDILFVAFGFPKQEEWMAANVGKVPVKVMMGVGGAFDYISGEVSRAPLFLRNMGLEWLYRLIRQPWRFRRQLALLQFILLVLAKRFHYSEKY